jgi:HD-GYP domain-containing protein (c-di-GMP phosphodiesterase class II)
MGMDQDEQDDIYYIALLHDIGKIGIPDNILNKKGALTPEERAIIQTHPAVGGKVLENFTALEDIDDGAKYHHERYDGKGYCDGLSGKDIPLVARIIGVADSYDAMASDRCYRPALSKEKILSELQENSGTQFDPEIVPYMVEMIHEGAVPVQTDEKPVLQG